MRQVFRKILDNLKIKKYLIIFIIATIVYFGIYYFTIDYFLGRFSLLFKTYFKSYSYPAFSLAILISLLIGINISLSVERFDKVRKLAKKSVWGTFGVFFGVLASGCPGCFIGAFPFIMSLFGVTATLGSLPFNGIELQILAVVLLSLSIHLITKDKL